MKSRRADALGVRFRIDPDTGAFYMWTACPVWSAVRSARRFLEMSERELRRPEDLLSRAVWEQDRLHALDCLLRADALREARRFRRRAVRWFARGA